MGSCKINTPAASLQHGLSDDDDDDANTFPNKVTKAQDPNVSMVCVSSTQGIPPVRAQAPGPPLGTVAAASGGQGTSSHKLGTVGVGQPGPAPTLPRTTGAPRLNMEDLAALFKTNEEATVNAIISQTVLGRGQGSSKKRKSGDKDPEETEVMLVDTTIEVKDDFSAVVDVKARSLLGRNPSDPESQATTGGRRRPRSGRGW